MTPLSNFLRIFPHPPIKTTGLISKRTEPVNSATVAQVSEDIKDCPVKAGDNILYLRNRGLLFGNEWLVNLDFVQAKL